MKCSVMICVAALCMVFTFPSSAQDCRVEPSCDEFDNTLNQYVNACRNERVWCVVVGNADVEAAQVRSLRRVFGAEAEGGLDAIESDAVVAYSGRTPLCLAAMAYSTHLARAGSEACKLHAMAHAQQYYEISARKIMSQCGVAPPMPLRGGPRGVERRFSEFAGHQTQTTTLLVRVPVAPGMEYEEFANELLQIVRREIIYDERGADGFSFTRSLLDSGNAILFWRTFVADQQYVDEEGRPRGTLEIELDVVRIDGGPYNRFLVGFGLELGEDPIRHGENEEANRFLREATFDAAIALFNRYPVDISSTPAGASPIYGLGGVMSALRMNLIRLSTGQETVAAAQRRTSDVPPREIPGWEGTVTDASLQAERIWDQMDATHRQHFNESRSGDSNPAMRRQIDQALSTAWDHMMTAKNIEDAPSFSDVCD